MGHEDIEPAADNVNAVSSEANNSQQEIARRIRTYQKQLRRLASELSLAEARERREIASDLHDHIGQALAYVSQKMTILRGNAVFSGMEDHFSEILSILDQTIRYTRDLTVEISPPVLYELGLSAAIDWLAERAVNRYRLDVVSTQTGTPVDVAEDVQVFVFKSIQEMLMNAIKHADATRIEISANWMPDVLQIVVSDDGRGFEAASFENGLAGDCCFGLFSIRERLSYIGGSLTIDSAPGRGTRVSISTPYRITGENSGD